MSNAGVIDLPGPRHRLSPTEGHVLRLFLDGLLRAAPPGAIGAVRVFGSRARGDSGETADLDVAVMARAKADSPALQRIATDAAWQAAEAADAHDLGLSVLVLSQDSVGTLAAAIARDGFDIWRAPW